MLARWLKYNDWKLKEIFEAAAEPKQFLEMQGGHNDGFIVSGPSYVNGLKAFINESL